MKRCILHGTAVLGLMTFAVGTVSGQVHRMFASSYAGPGDELDYAYTIQVDSDSNSYVAGMSGQQGVVLSYDQRGVLRWGELDLPDGAGWLAWIASALDAAGNLVVVGWGPMPGTGHDIHVAKFTPDGVRLWLTSIDGGVAGVDKGSDVAVDAEGNIYVSSESTDDDGLGFAVYRLTPTSEVVWRTRLPGYTGTLYGTVMNWDRAGHLALGGTAVNSFILARIAADGTVLWHQEYESSSDTAVFSDVGADSVNNLIAAASVSSPDHGIDYLTTKVDPDGNTLWQRRFDGHGSGRDVAWKLAIDSADSVIVTGITEYDPLGYYAEWGTVKYAADGTQEWVRTYSVEEFYSIEDSPFAIAVDGNDNVYVSGTSFQKYSAYDLALLKYTPAGEMLWAERYDGPEQRSEIGGWMARGPGGDIYLTGATTYLETGLDILVLRYSEHHRGDLNCDGLVDFADITPFVRALSDPDGYAQQYPDCPLGNRDINGDGLFDFGDINPFVELLSRQV